MMIETILATLVAGVLVALMVPPKSQPQRTYNPPPAFPKAGNRYH